MIGQSGGKAHHAGLGGGGPHFEQMFLELADIRATAPKNKDLHRLNLSIPTPTSI